MSGILFWAPQEEHIYFCDQSNTVLARWMDNINWFNNTEGAISGRSQYGNPLARGCAGNMNPPKWLCSVQVWVNLMQLRPTRTASGGHIFSQPWVLHSTEISVGYCVGGVCKSFLDKDMLRREREPSTGVTPELKTEGGRNYRQWEGGTMSERM